MTDKPDVLIIGAGHNGLVCAAYLAKAGRKVLVLERSPQVGGAAGTREFAKGFRVSGAAHILYMLKPRIIHDLKLEGHGLDLGCPALDTVSLAEDGQVLRFGDGKLEGRALGESDKAAYSGFNRRMERFARALAPQMLKTPPRLARAGFANTLGLVGLGWDLRFGLGKKAMRDFLRVAGMNIYDFLDEMFENEVLKSALSFDAVLGTAMEPRMPGTVITYLYRLAGGLGSKIVLPSGGMGAVTEALANAARSFGAEIRTGAAVDHVIMEGSRAVGIALEGGGEIRSPTIVSNADPKTTFLKLVGAHNLEAGFAHRIGHFRSKGRAAKLHVALDGLPDFSGLDEDALSNRLIIAPSRKYLEHAFNHSKYGEFSARPAMEIVIPTLSDPSLAPKGKHVLSVIAQYAPYDLKDGWNKGRDAFAKGIIKTLSAYAPDLKDKVRELECLAPPDLEREFGMTGGHWHHGELSLDQIFMMRPTFGAAQYKTPVDGLFLCGAGAHPGGGVMGAAGFNAANAILKGDK